VAAGSLNGNLRVFPGAYCTLQLDARRAFL
jgi:hypothetical protein